ncbi:AraC family transcriptional regulator [Entomohabitans teleogrylli]|uniref:AraC family transcriptional regulator n=1 Tax=Entomohabitans teleogrylli TaxID=1384589 RepID=UPI00073D3FD8|nr:helix-turn-helix transcriptional regulator [Entomohabitans teleogrylli]
MTTAHQPLYQLFIPPFQDALPAPSWFRVARMPAWAAYPQHAHPWGEFVYSWSGAMEVKLHGRFLMAPSHHGIWLPPGVEHQGINRHESWHCSFYLAPELCAEMPSHCCTLALNPLTTALLDHLRDHVHGAGDTPEAQRLLTVLWDQLRTAPRTDNFLPFSDDPLLGPVLLRLEAAPEDESTLGQLAAWRGVTARTLNRHCRQRLGMSLSVWRQRLRVVRALQMLETGRTVESVALELGYSSSSAFIAMFRRHTGVTPEKSRQPAPSRRPVYAFSAGR